MAVRVALLVVLALACAHGFAVPPARPTHKQRSGDLSLEELEGAVRGVRDAIAGFVSHVRHIFHHNRHAVLAVGGLLGLMHGATAAFTVMFFQSFGATGWPLVRTGLLRGQKAYEQAKETQPRESDEYAENAAPLRLRLVELAEKLAQMRREGAGPSEQSEVIKEMRSVRKELEALPPSRRAAPVLIAACEPAVVRDVCLGIWSGVTVSLAAACSSAVRTIGIGVSLGEAISKTGKVLLAKIEPALRRALSALPAEAVMLTYLGPSIIGSASLQLVGRSIGCWVAYRLQHLAAVRSPTRARPSHGSSAAPHLSRRCFAPDARCSLSRSFLRVWSLRPSHPHSTR